jgi:hypothetical protein
LKTKLEDSPSALNTHTCPFACLLFLILQAALKKKLKTIEAEMKQAESEKESRVKDAAKAVDAAKKAVAKAKVDLNKATQAVEAKRLELEALKVGGRVALLCLFDRSTATICVFVADNVMRSWFLRLHAVTTTSLSSCTLFVFSHFSLSVPVDVFLFFSHHLDHVCSSSHRPRLQPPPGSSRHTPTQSRCS